MEVAKTSRKDRTRAGSKDPHTRTETQLCKNPHTSQAVDSESFWKIKNEKDLIFLGDDSNGTELFF